MSSRLQTILFALTLAALVSACQPASPAGAPGATAGGDPQAALKTAESTAHVWDSGAYLVVYSASYSIQADGTLTLLYHAFDFSSADQKKSLNVTVDAQNKVSYGAGSSYPPVPYTLGSVDFTEQQALDISWSKVGVRIISACSVAGVSIQGHPAESISTQPYWLVSYWADPKKGAVAFIAIDSKNGQFLNNTPAINQQLCPGSVN